MDYFFRNGEGDEVIFVHEGSDARDHLRRRPLQGRRLRRHPAGDDVSVRARGCSAVPRLRDPGLIEIPPLPQPVRPDPRRRAVLPPGHPPARRAEDPSRPRDFLVKVRVRGGYQDYVLDYHPFDVVGWDGYLYPWTFSIHDFEPITGRIHQPPPSHQTFQGPNFVICSFCPRIRLRPGRGSDPVPPLEPAVRGDDLLRLSNFGSRKGISVGSITLHPSGLPHGPAPGLAEKALGVRETTELAVMCDTFRPLKLSALARHGRRALRAVLVRAPFRRGGSRRRDESPLEMDADRFLRELPALDDFGLRAPRDRRFARIVEGVENLATENVLALLNLGVVASPRRGVRRGRRLLRRESHRSTARQRERASSGSTASVSATVAWRRSSRTSSASASPPCDLVDAFEVVPSGVSDGTPVGVWYYDAAHDYDSQVEGLRIAEPLLAPGALMIVDDTDWEQVAARWTTTSPSRVRAGSSRSKAEPASPAVGVVGKPSSGRERRKTAAARSGRPRDCAPNPAGADRPCARSRSATCLVA